MGNEDEQEDRYKTQMPNKSMKKILAALVIRKIHIKIMV